MPVTRRTRRQSESRPTRLVLDAAGQQADVEEIFERYASDADVVTYLSFPRHRSLADTHSFLAISDREWAECPAGAYLIRSRTDGRLIGGTGLSFETQVASDDRLRPGEGFMGQWLRHRSARRHGGPGAAARCDQVVCALPPGASPLAACARQVRVRQRRHLATPLGLPESRCRPSRSTPTATRTSWGE